MRNQSLKQLLILAVMLIPVIGVIPAQTKAEAVTPIKIGIFAPYPSFVLGGLNIYGPWTVQGFQLGMIYATQNTNQTLAGRPYQLYYYDTQTNAATVGTLVTNAIENDGIDIIVGGTSSAVAAAIQPIAAQYHKLYFITPAADSSLTADKFNEYTFRLARNSYQDAITGIKYAWESTGARRYAIIAPAYSFGYSGALAMQQEVQKRGGSVVDTIYVPLGTNDFSSYMNRLLDDDVKYSPTYANGTYITPNTGVDMLMIIWAGAGFNYLYNGLANSNIAANMNISSGIIDTASMDYIQSTMTTGTLINQTGLAVYGYKLANNAVNDWLVSETISRKITPDYGVPGSASIYGLNFTKLYIPELFTPDAFATAQFIVNITNTVTDLNVSRMICGLEDLTIATPKGMEKLRAEDHQGLPEMYIAKIVNDTNPTSPSYHHLIGQLVQTLSGAAVAPPVSTTYTACKYQENPTTITATQTQTNVQTSVKTSTVSIPGFNIPIMLMGMTFAVMMVLIKKSQKN